MRVSVVVPTFRRPELLDRCLAALAAQNHDPADYEILIADDAASAETRRQVEEWSMRADPRVRDLPVQRRSRSSGGPQRRMATGTRADHCLHGRRLHS